jgi:hypothetical protein
MTRRGLRVYPRIIKPRGIIPPKKNHPKHYVDSLTDQGGGGNEPDWLVVSDFAGSTYEIEGDTVIPSDIYQSTTGITDGVGMSGLDVELQPAAASPLSGGWTALINFTRADEAAAARLVAFDSPSFNHEFLATFWTSSSNSEIDDNNGNYAAIGALPAGANIAAVTMTTTKLRVSVNGGAVVSVTPVAGSVLNGVGIRAYVGATITSAKWAAPQDDADLPSLSA